MTQPYDPGTYWNSQPAMPVRRPHIEQEAALMAVLDGIDYPSSILEIGVGAGRIGKLLCEEWPAAHYTGIDISWNRVAEAMENLPEHVELFEADLLEWDNRYNYDLVIAVEVLMHVKPSDLDYALERMRLWSRRHIVTVDWTEPIDGPIAPWNFLHDYAAHGLQEVAKVGQQSIHHWESK